MTHDEIKPYIRDCLSILRAGEALNVGREQLREIGEMLNRIDGISAMRMVAMAIRYMYPGGEGGEEGWHPGELDHAWDGIGEWVA